MLTFHSCNLRFGCHITKSRTFVETFTNYIYTAVPLRGYQLYISNSRSSSLPKCDPYDILEAAKLIKQNDLFLVIHGSLLYNMCGAVLLEKDDKYKIKRDNMLNGIVAELDIGVGLGCGVIVHFGSCKNRERGKIEMAKHIEIVLSKTSEYSKQLSKSLKITEQEFIKKRKLVLENSAGEGTKLGSTLKEIREIIDLVDKKFHKQLRVCIDTAHLHGQGDYNLGTDKGISDFYSDMTKYNLLDIFECFHLNDSKAKLGSHLDRHKNLCTGNIWTNNELQFVRFVDEIKKRNFPFICEPNKDENAKTDYETICRLIPGTRIIK